MALVLGMTAELKLETRCQNQIQNEINRAAPLPGEEILLDDLIRKHKNAIHRTRSSRKYNCHGLVFASRRTWIWDPAEVSKILRDDEYIKIPPSDVLAGDIALYFHEGDAQHAGIVVEVFEKPFTTKILGKWGFMQEVVHLAHDVPPEYGINIEYYRIKS